MEIVFIENDVMVGDEVITLKEITDILDVRHNDAMRKVETLSKQPTFGQLRKTRISYAKGKSVGTYVLNKVQAIAVGAKLNDKLLMNLVNRLESSDNKNALAELEDQRHKIKSLLQSYDIVGEFISEHDKKLKEHTEDIASLKNNTLVTYQQQKALQDAKNKKVYELAKDDKAMANKLHRKVWQLFKNRFHLPRYSELRVGQYEAGLEYIHGLTLSDMVG